MRRGEVWWVDFSGAVGGEIRKTRPAVIVSNDANNAHANRVQVVPLSSQTGKVFPCEAPVTLLGKPSKAMADQLSTVSKTRLTGRIALLGEEELRAVEQAIEIQLGLWRSRREGRR